MSQLRGENKEKNGTQVGNLDSATYGAQIEIRRPATLTSEVGENGKKF